MLGYLRHNLADYLKANIAVYFFITLVFVIGIVVGSLAVKALPDDQKGHLILFLQTFFQGLRVGTETGQDSSMLQTVLLSNVKPIILMWLLGFTVIGVPLILFIIFTRGFIIGFTVGFLVSEYIFKGVAFALVSVLPHNFFSVPALIAVGVAALNFSVMLVRRTPRTKAKFLYQATVYSFLCTIMLVFMFAASLVEIYLSPLFMKVIASFM